MTPFTPFPKIARLSRGCVVTEKIDGTNAQIFITPGIPSFYPETLAHTQIEEPGGLTDLVLLAGSRNRWITPEADNFGFARWVKENAAELFKLGKGQHFGEWWGLGIQRGYGLTEKRFSLFNTHRWLDNPDKPNCCYVVPQLFCGDFDAVNEDGDDYIWRTLENLRIFGSQAAPGFRDPEGIVIYHTAAQVMFKRTLKNDSQPKGLAKAA